MGQHTGDLCSFVLARVVPVTARPDCSHWEFPDLCPQPSGSEHVKRPKRCADGRPSAEQCPDYNSRYLPAAHRLECVLGLLCSPLPSSSPGSLTPSSFPTSSQHRASPLPVRPTSSAQNIPGRSKCCLDFLTAAVICSTLFFFLFLGLSNTLISVLLFFLIFFLLLQTFSLDHLLDITAMTRPYPWLDKLIQELPRWETGLGSSNECKHSNICYLHDKAVSLDLT